MLRKVQGNRLRTGTAGGGVAFLPESLALFARFTTPPTLTRMVLINTLIGSLITGGVWSKLDAFYVMAAADSQAARQNWIADQYNLTAVSSPTFTSDRGYTGDGAASYLRTGFVPSTATLPRYGQDSASYGTWIRTSATGLSRMDMGANSTHYSLLEFLNTNNLTAQINDASGAAATVVGAAGQSGLWGVNRSSAAGLKALKNGTQVATASDTSTGVPTVGFYTLARNNNGVASGFTPDQHSGAFIGGSMADAEHLSLYSALNTYLQAVGAA